MRKKETSRDTQSRNEGRRNPRKRRERTAKGQKGERKLESCWHAAVDHWMRGMPRKQLLFGGAEESSRERDAD